jgi:hypothetical protein
MKKRLIFIVLLLVMAHPVDAESPLDSDSDGLPDAQEISIYHTDPFNSDSDGDGYTDGEEIKHGFSPYNKIIGVRLDKNDQDKDGLNDAIELLLHSNPILADTDGDGINDGSALSKGIDPSDSKKLLEKRIIVDTKKQELRYYIGAFQLGAFKVSTGKKAMPTPKGEFKIINKLVKAWSKKYGLWMPYWMGLKDGSFGLHELPEWPNGYKEGANHLGKPVSHGCIRLGVGPAKKLYEWASIGTKVKIN